MEELWFENTWGYYDYMGVAGAEGMRNQMMLLEFRLLSKNEL